MDRQEYREFQSNQLTKSLIKFVEKHNRLPSDTSTDMEELALSCMLEERTLAYQNNDVKNKFQESDITLLETAGLHGRIMDVVRPNIHMKNAKDFVSFIKSRAVNAIPKLEETTWAKWRNWYYSFRRRPHIMNPKLDDYFEEQGLGRLLSAKMDSNQLKEFIFIQQIARWHEANGSIPSIKGKNHVERKLAKVISKPLSNYSRHWLATKGITLQSPPVRTETNPEQVVAVMPIAESNSDHRISRLERMVESLVGAVSSLTKQTAIAVKKKTNSTGEYTIKDASLSQRTTLEQSEILGLVIYDEHGTDITCGIENIITYPTGTTKYILRRPNADGTYGTRFFSWGTCRFIKEVLLNRRAQ